MAVRCDAVAPISLAQRGAQAVIFGDAPWQGRSEMADLGEFLHAKLFGFEKGLIDADGKPGVTLHQGAANAHGMHDRKDAGLAKIRLLDRRIARKHAADIGRSVAKT